VSEGASVAPLDLSIIIPAFNEETRLPRAIAGLRSYLDASAHGTEVLIVENGSADRTFQIAGEAADADDRFRVLHLPQRGKGRAIREGVRASRGRSIVLCDADFSMPVEEILVLLNAVHDGADVVIGSREAPGAHRIGEPAHRHLMGRVFNWLVRVVAVPGIEDTQCGFKAFRGEVARDLFARQRIDGWAFDVEVLFLAARRGYTIREVPITWRYDPSSRVRPVRDTIAMMRELVAIRRNAMRGLYG
jgi:dolichyl-phosphate beta-glucosyltransferase